MRRHLYSTLVGLFICFQAHSEVLFEGYYKVFADKVHSGFLVQRYEFDVKKKQFSTTYFIKTGVLAGNLQESLKAISNDKFQPISYQYTSQSGGAVKIIDVSIKNDLMSIKATDGKQSVTPKKKLEKGVFFSSFLGYLMLQNGFKVGKKFTYSAIAEEDADAFPGEAFLKSEEKLNGIPVFKIVNKFKGSEFVSLVNQKGEILQTESQTQKISTELVAKAEDATMGQMVPNKTLITLFGKVPEGKINIIAQQKSPAVTPSSQTPPPAAAPTQSKPGP